MRAKFSPKARDDLHAIWRYVVEKSGSIAIADRLMADIAASALRYAQHPLLGEARSDVAPGLRSFVVGKYVAFYRPLDDGIKVVQVIHGASDIPSHLREDSL